MKLSIVLFAIVGMACGESLQVKNIYGLHDDLMDFMKLIPEKELLDIFLNYLANDEEVQAAVAYVQSDEFKNLVVDVDSKPEFKELLNYLEAAGLDAYGFLNRIHELLDLPPVVLKSETGTRSIRQMLDEMKAVLPLADLKALLYEKLEKSPEFKALYDKLRSEDFHAFVKTVRDLPETQRLVGRLRDLGVEVDRIVDFIKSLFGWTH